MVSFGKVLDTSKPPAEPVYYDENPRTAFMAEVKSYGFSDGKQPLPAAAEIGAIVRITAPSDKPGAKSGWYWYSEFADDHKPGAYIGIGVFGSWKGDPERVVWSSKRRESMTPAEAGRLSEQMAAAKAAHEAQTRANQAAAAEKALKIWDEAKPAPANHPYLVKKGIKAHGARISRGAITVPLYDDTGAISTLEFIDVTGGKLFLKYGRKKGCAFPIGEAVGETVYIVEGYATGATIHEATGEMVYVAFDAGNLMDVASRAKDRHPDAQIIIAGDDDAWTTGNPGRAKANAAADVLRVRAVFPEFSDTSSKPTDFNDMATLHGIEAVRAVLRNDFWGRKLETYTYPTDFDPSRIPPRPWIIPRLLLRKYITAILGPGGVSKSSVALLFAMAAALGRSLIDCDIKEQVNVLLLNNEDDRDEIDRRVAAICQHHSIPFGELTDRLTILSGYGTPYQVAHQYKDGGVEATPVVGQLIDFCRLYDTGLVVADPFVSTHDVSENDNTAIEKVVTQFRRLAKETNAAILLIHHTKKAGGNSEVQAGDAESSRGASSLINGARIALTLARMSPETANKVGLDWEEGNRLVRMDDAKMNYALKSEETTWFKMVSEELPNGDSVGVPIAFNLGDIRKRAEEARTAEKANQTQARVTDIARDAAACMTNDEQPQAEVLGAYMARKDLKKSAASDAFMLLPVGKDQAVAVMVGNVRTRVWKERCGSGMQNRYTIHKAADE